MSAGEGKSLLWCDVWMGASCVPDKLFWNELGDGVAPCVS